MKEGKTAIPDDAIENIKKNKVALKGPLAVRPRLTALLISL
jgi:isocitrate dehydrogenase (NAD+)